MRIVFIDDACGRYTLNAKSKDLKKHYNLASEPKDLLPNYNVAPSQVLPVVTADDSGKPNLELMEWGVPAPWKEGLRLINTRDDKIFAPRSFWKGMVSKRRVLIPATGFYEWRPEAKGPKTPFFIHPKQTDLFSFAGTWTIWRDSDGKEKKYYSIITTAPNKEMSGIHNRMPVILHQSEETDWLKSSLESEEDIMAFLHPYEDRGLEMYEVSRDVNSASINEESLLKPVATQ